MGGMHLLGRSRLAQAPAVTVQAIDPPSDEAALARGAHIANAISLCTDCHGQSLEGAVFMDEPPIGRVVAPNLTGGQGGIGGTYTDEDWIRAIGHGVGGDGRTLVIMPSNAFARLSDNDLGALVAYLKSVPPVDNELPAREIIFPGTIFMGVLGYGELPVSLIDHNTVQTVSDPVPGDAAAQGEYLSHIGGYTECHGARLAGRVEENGPPQASWATGMKLISSTHFGQEPPRKVRALIPK